MLKTKDKILFVRIHRLGHIPSARYAAEILSEKGEDVVVAEYGYLHEKVKERPGPIARIRFACPLLAFIPKKLRVLPMFLSVWIRLACRLILSGRPKLIIAHGPQEQVMACALSKMFGVPFAAHVHEVYEKKDLTPTAYFFFLFEKSVLQAAKFVIFSEKTRAAIYKERYGLTQPIFLAANCPRKREPGDKGTWREELHIPQNAPVLLYVGGIGEANPLELGIEAVSRIRELYFVLIGWANESHLFRLKKLAKRMGVSNRVKFVGEVEDKWPYLDGADLGFCLYRPYELRLKHLATASNKLMESLAGGLAVISHSGEDFREVVERERVGLCVKSEDGAEITRVIRRLLQDAKPYQFRARKLHEERFHYEAQFADILEEIKKIPAQKALSAASRELSHQS